MRTSPLCGERVLLRLDVTQTALCTGPNGSGTIATEGYCGGKCCPSATDRCVRTDGTDGTGEYQSCCARLPPALHLSIVMNSRQCSAVTAMCAGLQTASPLGCWLRPNRLDGLLRRTVLHGRVQLRQHIRPHVLLCDLCPFCASAQKHKELAEHDP